MMQTTTRAESKGAFTLGPGKDLVGQGRNSFSFG